MTFTHGKNTFVSVNGSNLSPYTDSSGFPKTADKHDVTTYGATDHAYNGGLGDATFTMSGTYDDTTVGPFDILDPLVGQLVTIVRRVEGTGSGRPQQTFTALLEKFETSNPVADMVKWSADFQKSGAITTINQP